MNESKFEFNGALFIAQKSARDDGCDGCAFHNADCVKLVGEKLMPPCAANVRADMRNVIFIRPAQSRE